MRDRKRRYRNPIRRKLRGVKNKREIALISGGIVGWVFTNIIEKKMTEEMAGENVLMYIKCS